MLHAVFVTQLGEGSPLHEGICGGVGGLRGGAGDARGGAGGGGGGERGTERQVQRNVVFMAGDDSQEVQLELNESGGIS